MSTPLKKSSQRNSLKKEQTTKHSTSHLPPPSAKCSSKFWSLISVTPTTYGVGIGTSVLELLLLVVSLAFEVVDVLLKARDVLFGFFDWGGSATLSLPPLDPILLLADGSAFGVQFFAGTTLLLDLICLHDQFHAASLAGTVLFGAVLAEMSPLVVAASHTFLIIKTHGDEAGYYGWPNLKHDLFRGVKLTGCGWKIVVGLLSRR
jgi:hypothetical protein